MMNTLAKPNIYIIDLVFFGQYPFLFLMDVNTRKLHHHCLSLIPYDVLTYYYKKSVNTTDVLNTLSKLTHVSIKHIRFGNDKLFTSKLFKGYCKRKCIDVRYEEINDIDDERHPVRDLTSILDRSVRSIRKYMTYIRKNIHIVDKVSYSIVYYNVKPHSGLRSVIKMKDVTSNMVDKDLRLQKQLMININRNNSIKTLESDFYLKEGDIVRVYKPKESFNVKRSSLFYDGYGQVIHRVIKSKKTYEDKYGNTYEFVEKNNMLYKVELMNYNNQIVTIPRWQMVKIK